jgi:hypothetical protein
VGVIEVYKKSARCKSFVKFVSLLQAPKKQDVSEIDWQRFFIKRVNQTLLKQTPQRLEQTLDRLRRSF